MQREIIQKQKPLNRTKPRKGKGKEKACRRCGNSKGLISKYRIGLCRRCFKDFALQIGFQKYD
ncbi:MAG TPA: 30S ribosomal protein S14 [Candidatus Diapherotrites archaeon]|uniref:30S ribosomal protein S14 n=1 Tax=Candidatus Iainarchaeum sp. TaxID=3101447 RepID=A0A7J4JFH9_9ARCH|nr:30S ribosomal protein S14 [Candidatus Diapherotrites archaeon]HIH16523.1 30S ribosomal protein S14 [Candidatus Diapherotrites archaeon]